ncbi:MAG: PKD domain-containing protein, partial [Desulfobacterales bacterium]
RGVYGDPASYEIFLYNGTTTNQLTNNDYRDGLYLSVNDNGWVVWVAYTGTGYPGGATSDSEIFLYNGTSTIQLTDNDYPDWAPRLNNSGHVVWVGKPASVDDDFEVFLYNGTTSQLTNNNYDESAPVINDNGQLGWFGEPVVGSGVFQVFVHDGTTTTQVTSDGLEPPVDLEINNNGQVAYSGDIALTGYVFLATPVFAPPVANAGADQVVCDEVILDGSQSSDSDGTIESYSWQLNHRGDSAYNRVATDVNPTVSNLEPGFYDVTLTVTDNDSLEGTDTMEIAAIGPCVSEPCDPCDPCESSDATIRMGTFDITNPQGEPSDEFSTSSVPVFRLNYTVTEKAKFPCRAICIFRAFGHRITAEQVHNAPGRYYLSGTAVPFGVSPGIKTVRAIFKAKKDNFLQHKSVAKREITIVE